MELPEEAVNQLIASLENVTNTEVREKLTSGLSKISEAGLESARAFEEEESLMRENLQHWHGKTISMLRVVEGRAIWVLSELKDSLSGYVHQLDDLLEIDGHFLSHVVDHIFLAVCFLFTAYIFYNKEKTAEPSRIYLSSFIFAVFTTVWLWMGVEEAVMLKILPVLCLGALAGKMPGFLPPSRLWPGRKPYPRAPKTWSTTLAYILGFLLSSGFLAWVAMIMENDLKDRLF